MIEATPYYNSEAELYVLSCALNDSHAAKLVGEMSTDDFYFAQHKVIHDVIVELLRKNQPVDIMTVYNQSLAGNRSEAMGGETYLMDVCGRFAVTYVNAKQYIDIVKGCAARRKLRIVAKQISDAAGDYGQDIDAIREAAALAIRDIKVGIQDEVISQKDACLRTYAKLEDQQRKSPEEAKRIMTGIRSLDNMLGGFEGSKMVVIGARPSVGKSIFALTICVNAARDGKKVLLVSLEMDETEITERILAEKSGVSLNEITSPDISGDAWMNLAEAIVPVSSYPIYYCLETSTVDRVRKAAFQLYENGGLDMICVDYIQLMEATYAKKQNRQEQVAEISRGLRKLSQELKIPIIVLTQLNRSSETVVKGQKVKREPTMSEARESGAIEQDANVFMLLHEPSIDEMGTEDEKHLFKNWQDKGIKVFRIIVDKNRQGRKGRVTIGFDGAHMRFLPISHEREPEQQEMECMTQ